jgi:uncharacterized surface protein with fasciclin (FAS1) repeats
LTITPGNGLLEVSFTEPFNGGSPIIGYEYSTDDGDTWEAADPTVTGSPLTITGLDDGTSYPVQIRAVNVVGEGDPSGTVSATTQLGPPTNVTLTGLSGELLVSFIPPTAVGDPITSYEYSLDDGTTWVVVVQASPGSPFTISGLTNGVPETVLVRAHNSTGLPGRSSVAVTGTPMTIPSAPTAVTITPGAGRMQVSFTAPFDGGSPITSYEYSVNDGVTWIRVSQTIPGSPFTITELDDGTTYPVRVRAVNAVGPGEQSITATETTQIGPPLNLRLTSQSEALVVSFTAPFNDGSPITGYEYSLDGGTTWLAVVQASPGSPFTISGLTNGVSETVTVRARNAQSLPGLASVAVTGTPMTVPSAPTNLRLTSRSEALVVSFAAPFNGGSPITGYEYSLDGGTTWVAVVQASPGSPFTISGLANGTTYSVRIRAVNAVGDGEQSIAVVETTQLGIPVVAPEGPTRQVGRTTISTGLRIGVDPINISLSVDPADGEVQTEDGSTPRLEVVRDRGVRTSGGGLAPGSELRVLLPLRDDVTRTVAVLVAGRDGRFEAELPFDARFDRATDLRPFPIGAHVLQLVGTDSAGRPVQIEQTLRIRQPDPAPELDRTSVGLPRARDGAALATRAGLPEIVRVIPDSEERSARVEGDGWRIALRLGTGSGAVASSSLGGARVEISLNETAEVTGDGFLPGTRADVWLFSTPVLLGSYLVEPDGTFRGDVEVTDVPFGEHTMQLQGVGEDGYVRSANLEVFINPPPVAIAEVETETDADRGIVSTADGLKAGRFGLAQFATYFLLLAAFIGLLLSRRRLQRWRFLLAGRRREEEPLGRIVDVVSASGGFTTLVTALRATGLVETLQGDGPFTVFAPTDQAFAELPEGLIDKLLLPENAQLLTRILSYNVVHGTLRAGEMTNAEVPTYAGQALSLDSTDGVRVNGARVVLADLLATNGVIHAIKSVILPPDIDLNLL